MTTYPIVSSHTIHINLPSSNNVYLIGNVLSRIVGNLVTDHNKSNNAYRQHAA